MIYDGDCGFCKRWIARWHRTTGDRVCYAPYQQAADQFPDVPREAFARSVHLITPDGAVYRGAEAVFRSLEAAGHRRPVWFYRHVPGWAAAAERIYDFVASHRQPLIRVDRFIYGNESPPPTHHLTRWAFLRLLAVIYGIAFASFGVQARGLVGERGILPLDRFLEVVREHLGSQAYRLAPTVFWFAHSDGAIAAVCIAGVVIAALAFLRIAPGVMFFLLWGLYLSICVSGQIFMNYQWDALLLETGLLAVFLAPWRLWPRLDTEAPPSAAVLGLLRWLLFRLMFASGAAKLFSADPVWWDLSALQFHYETQPLPTWIGWYAHQLPDTAQRACCLVMFVIELAVPFFIFVSGRLRQLAFALLVALQVLIALTGNYAFFNLLTLALCVCLLGDDSLRRCAPPPIRRRLDSPLPRRPRPLTQWLATPIAAVFLFVLSAVLFFGQIVGREHVPAFTESWLAAAAPFRSVNTYGLFADMTTERPEIVIEGSDDGRTWREYDFKWKPGSQRRPGFVAPHQPRLDWQMWFAALGSPQSRPVVVGLMIRLLEAEPVVLRLLDENPFPSGPPQFIRAIMYQYHFTDRAARRETGDWWRRERIGAYSRVLTRRGGEIRVVR